MVAGSRNRRCLHLEYALIKWLENVHCWGVSRTQNWISSLIFEALVVIEARNRMPNPRTTSQVCCDPSSPRYAALVFSTINVWTRVRPTTTPHSRFQHGTALMPCRAIDLLVDCRSFQQLHWATEIVAPYLYFDRNGFLGCTVGKNHQRTPWSFSPSPCSRCSDS